MDEQKQGEGTPVTVERTTALIAMAPGGDGALGLALAGMGLELPRVGRFTEAGGLLLARAAPHQMVAMRAGMDVPLMDELAPLGAVAEVIDQSDARVAVRVSGPSAAGRLAHLVPLDLDGSAFGPGQCAQTMVAHLSVLLLKLGPDAYELQCGRSFAGSFLRAVSSGAA